jgi:hypothetical protein
MVAARQNSTSWEAGRVAGLQGEPNRCPPTVDDKLAWYSGYIEGEAERSRNARLPLTRC